MGPGRVLAAALAVLVVSVSGGPAAAMEPPQAVAVS